MNILKERLGEEHVNYQGCLMKIIEYNRVDDIVVEFQDEYKGRVHTQYQSFKNGNVKNPYYPSVFEVGITGNKYPSSINRKMIKEYRAWKSVIERSYYEFMKKRCPTYKEVTCCSDWLLYENFYEWLHSQKNFDKWLNEDGWCLDKDIIVKGNKIYSPEKCCLVPKKINMLFTKSNASRGDLPIGVTKGKYGFEAKYRNTNKKIALGVYNTPEQAFQVYKEAKEKHIKQVAQEEYDKGNITKPCYEAMMDYEVEITD